MSNKELLPCPFCSGEAKYDNSEGNYYIFCDECGARTFGFNKEHAFNEWNKRAQIDDDESNYPVFPDSSKVNQPVQVPEVVENGNCEYLKLLDYIKFCRNASAKDIRKIHDRARDLIANYNQCCKKSCKEEIITTEDLLDLELRFARKKIKFLEQKIQKLLERENDWVTCPSQQFKRCEHAKGCKEND